MARIVRLGPGEGKGNQWKQVTGSTDEFRRSIAHFNRDVPKIVGVAEQQEVREQRHKLSRVFDLLRLLAQHRRLSELANADGRPPADNHRFYPLSRDSYAVARGARIVDEFHFKVR